MNNNSTYRFTDTTTFVMGNRKNAGKTTFMNWVLHQIRKVDTPAIATIGIDGEANDQIDGRAKPLVKTTVGDAIVTSYPMLKKSNGQYQIEKAFPIKTPLGQLVLATTKRAGTIELVGPEHNEQLKEIVDYLKKDLGYKSIVIDGAASRLTPVGAVTDSGFYYVLNIDRKNLKKAIDQMQLLSFGAQLKQADSNCTGYIIDGALTVSKTSQIPEPCNQIIINNLTSIFLNYEQLSRLNIRVDIQVKDSLNLMGFVVILNDIQEAEFNQMYQQKGIETELICNPYVHK